MHKVYSLFAVILPVALGLGLEYLYIMDRLPAAAVFAIVFVMIVLIPGVPATVRAMRDDDVERDRYGIDFLK